MRKETSKYCHLKAHSSMQCDLFVLPMLFLYWPLIELLDIFHAVTMLVPYMVATHG